MDTCANLRPGAVVDTPQPEATEFWREMAARELTCGQQQYSEWECERDALRGLIEEVEQDFCKRSANGEQEVSSLALQATRARCARLEALLAAHPDWRLATIA